ncbi:hypothetical protein C2G38_2101702, partial [Gigaspora rosea]
MPNEYNSLFIILSIFGKIYKFFKINFIYLQLTFRKRELNFNLLGQFSNQLKIS